MISNWWSCDSQCVYSFDLSLLDLADECPFGLYMAEQTCQTLWSFQTLHSWHTIHIIEICQIHLQAPTRCRCCLFSRILILCTSSVKSKIGGAVFTSQAVIGLHHLHSGLVYFWILDALVSRSTFPIWTWLVQNVWWVWWTAVQVLSTWWSRYSICGRWLSSISAWFLWLSISLIPSSTTMHKRIATCRP